MPDLASTTALIIMARYPELGKTKTRLAHMLGEGETLGLYRAFLEDIAQRHAGQAYLPCWAYTPADVDYRALITTFTPEYASSMCYFPQEGIDFGTRLHNAFRWTQAQGFDYSILIGTDSPQIRREHILAARKALDDVDVVVGPADDGGYYLLGMRAAHDVFSGIPMSTNVVTQMTLEAAQRQGLTVRLLDTLFDVDELSDLVRLSQLLKEDPTLAPVTASYLKTMRSFHDHNATDSATTSGDTATLNLHRAD